MPRGIVRKACAATILVGGVGIYGAVPVADAAYPSNNGDIAFSSTRLGNIAIYQVDPNDPSLGTAGPDQSATAALTLGGADVEPFYSPDGSTVYFSSDRDAADEWVIYSVPSSAPESASSPAAELSQVSGSEDHNDFAPSVAPDGHTVVFNRDNTSIDTLWAPTGASSVCTLYTPPDGLAPGNDTSGYDSRVVFDPVDESKLVYVDASGDLHLLSGISSNGKTNPCNQSSTTGLVDTQLTGPGGLVFSTGQYATGADANPDWSPNGQDLVFDSTRGGGDTLFIIHLTSSPPTGYPIWPSLAAPNETISNEPVFSPSGAELAYVQPRKGSNVYDEDLVSGQNGAWMPNGTATDLTVQDPSGVSFDDEPDWQPIPVPPVLPESPFVPALPILGGLGVGGALLVPFLNRRRRRAALA